MDRKQFTIGILFFFSLCDLAWWALYYKYLEFVGKGIRIAKAVSSLALGAAWYFAAWQQLAPPIWAAAFAVIWLGIACWHVIEIWDKN